MKSDPPVDTSGPAAKALEKSKDKEAGEEAGVGAEEAGADITGACEGETAAGASERLPPVGAAGGLVRLRVRGSGYYAQKKGFSA